MKTLPVATHLDRRNNLSLDSLNFFLADVRDGLGPYLAIYLLAVHHWEPASIGMVMTLAGIAALITQTPAGALVDSTYSTPRNGKIRNPASSNGLRPQRSAFAPTSSATGTITSCAATMQADVSGVAICRLACASFWLTNGNIAAFAR